MDKKFVWIGAGTASNPIFNFDDFDSIVLVDARKEACDELSEHFEENGKIATKQVCISDRSGKAKFFQFNVEELSALAEPTEVKSLYPGLRGESSFDIDTVNITDFLEQELVDGATELFIDIPATSWRLVRELSDSKLLDRITKLHVSIGTAPALYEGSSELAELSSLLKANFFDEIGRNSSDPDIPVVSFKLNENLKASEKLKSENSELQRQLTKAKQHNEIIEHKVNELSLNLTEKNKLIESKDIEIQELNSDIATYKVNYQKKSLECDEKTKNLDSSKSSAQALKDELSEERSKVDLLTKELDEKANKLKATLEDCERLEEGKRKIGDELVDSQSKLADLTERFDAQANELQATLETLERTKVSERKIGDELVGSQSKLADLTERFDAQANELQASLETLEQTKVSERKISDELADSQSKLAGLTERFDAQESELQATLETLERTKENELKTRNELVESQAYQVELRSGLDTTTDKLKTALEELERAKEAEIKKSNEVSSYETKLNELQHKVNEVNAVNVNLSKSIDISSKQNLKLQTDLDDLRQQFSANQENVARLKSLISELYEKLSRAASFYHRLEKSNPELLGHNND